MNKIRLKDVGDYAIAKKIVKIVEDEFDLTFEGMLDKKPSNDKTENYEELTTARWLMLSLISNYYTLAATSYFIGRSCTSAAIHAKRKLDKRVRTNTNARVRVVKILQLLNELPHKPTPTSKTAGKESNLG